jgi:hypothetical protein
MSGGNFKGDDWQLIVLERDINEVLADTVHKHSALTKANLRTVIRRLSECHKLGKAADYMVSGDIGEHLFNSFFEALSPKSPTLGLF